MPRGLYVLVFAVLVLILGLSSCVRIQVHVNAPRWLGGGPDVVEPSAPVAASVPAPPAIGPVDAEADARRAAQERVQRQKQENLDGLITGAVRVASDTQAWMLKPRAFGGSNGAFTGVTLEKLGYVLERDGSYLTLDGSYTLERVRDSSLRVWGISEQFANEVVVHVTGATPSALRTEVITNN